MFREWERDLGIVSLSDEYDYYVSQGFEYGYQGELDYWSSIAVGPEWVTNGGFDTDTDWNKGLGVTISGGEIHFTGNTNSSTVQSNSLLVIDASVRVTFDITAYTSGFININTGGGSRSADFSGVGTHTYDSVVIGAGSLYLQEDHALGFVGSVDNLSVKEIL